MEPGEDCPPMPWSMSNESAFVTAPHCKVVELPAVIVVAVALKVKVLGVPLQLGGVFVTVGVGDAGAATVIFTETVAPNNAALELRKRQLPV